MFWKLSVKCVVSSLLNLCTGAKNSVQEATTARRRPPHLTTFAGDDAIMHSGGLIATDLAGNNFDLG